LSGRRRVRRPLFWLFPQAPVSCCLTLGSAASARRISRNLYRFCAEACPASIRWRAAACSNDSAQTPANHRRVFTRRDRGEPCLRSSVAFALQNFSAWENPNDRSSRALATLATRPGRHDEQNALSESDRRLNAALAALYGPRKAQGWAQRLRAARRKMAWRHSRVLPTTVIQIF
jgi:hypothetical protein